MSGYHCGGENIYSWDDGSSTNYGTFDNLLNCKATCDIHDECAAFVFYNDICAFWARAPLNPYKSSHVACYIKSNDGW